MGFGITSMTEQKHGVGHTRIRSLVLEQLRRYRSRPQGFRRDFAEPEIESRALGSSFSEVTDYDVLAHTMNDLARLQHIVTKILFSTSKYFKVQSGQCTNDSLELWAHCEADFNRIEEKGLKDLEGAPGKFRNSEGLELLPSFQRPPKPIALILKRHGEDPCLRWGAEFTNSYLEVLSLVASSFDTMSALVVSLKTLPQHNRAVLRFNRGQELVESFRVRLALQYLSVKIRARYAFRA